MSSEQNETAAAPEGAASAGEDASLDMVTVIAESTDGVNVWYASETIPAHQYDAHPEIRAYAAGSARASLAAELPHPMPMTMRTDRWTMDLGSEDES